MNLYIPFLEVTKYQLWYQRMVNKKDLNYTEDQTTLQNLSEGEKTAIAFSYFLTKLKEVEDEKKTIVYIDDPISSLDHNHIFQINAIIKDFFFTNNNANKSWELKYDQLFISTHNFDFFSLLRELPLAKKGTVEYFFVRRVSKNEATIESLPKSIKNYSSEYHYLFNEIYSYHKSENKNEFEKLYSIPNAGEKIY